MIGVLAEPSTVKAVAIDVVVVHCLLLVKGGDKIVQEFGYFYSMAGGKSFERFSCKFPIDGFVHRVVPFRVTESGFIGSSDEVLLHGRGVLGKSDVLQDALGDLDCPLAAHVLTIMSTYKVIVSFLYIEYK